MSAATASNIIPLNLPATPSPILDPRKERARKIGGAMVAIECAIADLTSELRAACLPTAHVNVLHRAAAKVYVQCEQDMRRE